MMNVSSMKIIPVLRLFTKVDKCLFYGIWLMFMITQSQRVNGCLKKAANANETELESFVGKASDLLVDRNCNFMIVLTLIAFEFFMLRSNIFYNHSNV